MKKDTVKKSTAKPKKPNTVKASPVKAAAPKPEEIKKLRGLRKVLAVLMDGLGVGRDNVQPVDTSSMDAGTRLANERTDMAHDRTFMAAERTLMAWIRTSISMISFGFTIGKLGQAVQSVEAQGLLKNRTFEVSQVAYLLVVFGTVALIAASVQYSIRVHNLRSKGFRKQLGLTLIFAIAISYLGIAAFTSLAKAM